MTIQNFYLICLDIGHAYFDSNNGKEISDENTIDV